MLIAETSIYPISEGTSLSRYVKAAVEAIESTGLKTQTCAMGTAIEAETLDDIFDAVKKGHDAILDMGAKRIVINLKVDDRLDKDASMEKKLRSIDRLNEAV